MSSLVQQLRDAVYQARPRVYKVGAPTPLEQIFLPGHEAEIWVKREDLGPIKAYKWRGAFNAMACLSEGARGREIVAASAGNHAQGIALAARELGAQARIFMPLPTPQVKRDAVLKHGAGHVTIELAGDSFSETQANAIDYAERTNATFIPPYDDLDVMAGQGTLADEIVMSGAGPFDRAYVAIGGGGLAGATATILKSYWPSIKVIGVEGEGQASMSAAFAAGGPTPLDYVDVFCDGTAVTQVGELTYDICRSQLDEICTVTNAEVCSAIKAHWDYLRIIPEPSGAMSLAAYLADQRAGRIPPGERVLTILCGANMDFAKIASIARQAGIDESVRTSWKFTIPEQRGSLSELLAELPQGVNITEMHYGRTDSESQYPVLSFSVPRDTPDALATWLASPNVDATEITDFPGARYRVIPFSPALFTAPLFVEVEFPERAGALFGFMREVRHEASLCYFDYRYSGERVGRALLGLDYESPVQRDAARERLISAKPTSVRSIREVPMDSL